MDISVKALEEAVSIRRQIDNLEGRLSAILGGAPARPTAEQAPAKKKGALTAAGRRKLSALMKARWAAARKKTTPKKPRRNLPTLNPGTRYHQGSVKL